MGSHVRLMPLQVDAVPQSRGRNEVSRVVYQGKRFPVRVSVLGKKCFYDYQ